MWMAVPVLKSTSHWQIESDMQQEGQVIFIDDEKPIRLAGVQTLELAGYEIRAYERADVAINDIADDWFGVVVTDIKMPGMDGLSFMEKALAQDADLPVILISGHGDIAMAVEAMRNGAYDFLEKPFPTNTLTEVVNRAMEKRRLTLENRSLRQELASQSLPGPRIIGRTSPVQRLRALIAQVADAEADVLVLGETGTGKELVARSLHEHSHRRDHNYVPINCGAMPENLMESELFGHEAGAFTDARKRRIGKFEHANGGTLFLDEIESMSMPMQIRLLRVLQERCIERLGSNELLPLDMRVVAATKVDLKDAAERQEFREDLYYRLNVVTLEIPSLRDRRDDIPLLFQHFVLIASARCQREVPALASEGLHYLLSYDWPGNVRELRNVAERYVLLGEGCDYHLGTLMNSPAGTGAMSLPDQVACFEKSLIEQELTRQRGNIKATMEVLGMPRKTLYDKMQKYGLERSHYQ